VNEWAAGAKIVTGPYGWRLERDDRLIRAATFDGVGAYGDSRRAAAARHSNPSWNLVLAPDGQVVVDGERLAGALIPPLVSHEGGATRGFVSLYIAPWMVRGPSRITPLTSAQVRRYLDALSDDWDLTALRQEVGAEFGAAPPMDPRVAHVVRHVEAVGDLADLASDVGLSAPRLRALAGQNLGVPLVRLRQWSRLKTAVAVLASGTISDAAAAGRFADQAHLTRSMQRMLGRSPASLLSPRCSAGTAGDQP
jgi:AraC-like DNA-binding protein